MERKLQKTNKIIVQCFLINLFLYVGKYKSETNLSVNPEDSGQNRNVVHTQISMNVEKERKER